jgi:hypothetical protein
MASLTESEYLIKTAARAERGEEGEYYLLKKMAYPQCDKAKLQIVPLQPL